MGQNRKEMEERIREKFAECRQHQGSPEEVKFKLNRELGEMFYQLEIENGDLEGAKGMALIFGLEKEAPIEKQKAESEAELKPVTYVTTYRGVEGYNNGWHFGRTRSVLIAGAEIPGEEVGLRNRESYGGTLTASKKDADQAFRQAEESLEKVLSRVDRMYVYLGKDGAGAGFEYVKRLMDKNGRKDIKLVACDCNQREKDAFAHQYWLPIIPAECGGRRKLAEIVRQELGE